MYVSCGEVQDFFVEFYLFVITWGYQMHKNLCPLTSEKKHIFGCLHSDKVVKHLQLVFDCLYEVTLNAGFYFECSGSLGKTKSVICRKLIYCGTIRCWCLVSNNLQAPLG